MMKALIQAATGAILAAAFCAPASAQGLLEPADGGFYVSGFVGGAFPDVGNDLEDTTGVEFDDDVYFGGAVGAKLPFQSFGFIHTRIEAEVSYTEIGLDADDAIDDLVDGGFGDSPTAELLDDLDDVNFDFLLIQGNSYADLKFGDDPVLIPYIGGGLGVAIAGDIGNDTETNFATNTSIGVTLPINNLDLYTEGRYIRVYGEGPDFDSFTLTGGIRIRF